ncbi:MAG: alkaline phosphatase PafA [Flavobacteriales bacterium]
MKTLVALLFILIGFAGCAPSTAQKSAPVAAEPDRFADRPQLVVGITVDQMKMEYLYRYWHLFTDGGFKRLVNDGFVCSNHHFNYAPTVTASGHAAIFTGTTPAYNGITGNDWYQRGEGFVYCASDSTRKAVGTIGRDGQMSPHRLLTTTISDELRLSNNFKSKVIGIAVKDRGAILPAGHQPTAAYWFVGKDEGVWATSDYYMNELPEWVNAFNAKKLPESYMEAGWNLLLSKEAYDISAEDNNPYEYPFRGQERAAFPYDFTNIALNRYDAFKSTPFAATMSVDFAIEAIKAEQLGRDQYPDLLAISFSNTDYAGHQFGPQSVEVQDTYLRLDRDLKRLFDFLDKEVGNGKYLVFLSADHGGAHVPSYINKYNMPAGYWKPQAMLETIEERLRSAYGEGTYVLNYSNEQIFLDRELIASKSASVSEVAAQVAAICREYPEVQMAWSLDELMVSAATDPVVMSLQRGIHQQRSGDVVLINLPGYIEYGFRGTTHGSPFVYDTHVPLIFYGHGVKQGELTRRVSITDIAPTVARLLRIGLPTGSTGDVIHELCD